MDKVNKQDFDLLSQILLKLIESENTIRNSSRITMNFYSTLLVTVAGGLLFFTNGIEDLSLYGLCFLVGGLFMAIVPMMAFFHFKSDYQRQVETITMQAKIEDVLGLTSVDKYQTTYWNHEPIVPMVYIDNRKKFDSSKQFVNSFLKRTDIIYVRVYYAIFSIVGCFYMGYGIYIIYAN